MPSAFFTLMIDNEIVTFEKSRIIAIEPAYQGTRIVLEASHTEEEPIIYLTPESYEDVMRSYSS
ncbi:hypothetical protein [Hufsiella ginkgonis]|uniref:Uncharacterized protein n=1 Tax=Hufsiella ginkgonis TaxID=2695274 RepID=A0A7K1XXG6_9SPHI|nr:hypothetical protein [Hufsiella ginkgonis]MXV15701.1 hypothetical protein [Hufsiella ginkgonis]